MKKAAYAWESLKIYEWTNEFARVVGGILADTPSRHQIHVHNLIGQTLVMSNAIAGANKELAPGEPPLTVEHRRAWLVIGYSAARQAIDLLGEISKVCPRCNREVARGLDLVAKIKRSFEDDLDALDDRAEPTPARHLA